MVQHERSDAGPFSKRQTVSRIPTRPKSFHITGRTFADKQERLRKQMRRLRLLCPLLRLHILLLLSQGRSPTQIPDWLLCSRSSIYEATACWWQGWRPDQKQEADASSVIRIAPALRRSVWALLGKSPDADGWCRTRWNFATLALSLQARRGIQVSAETMRQVLTPGTNENTTWRVPGTGAPERFTIVSDHTKRINSSGLCSTHWNFVIRRVAMTASMWSRTTKKFTKRKPSSSGWRLILTLNCSGCRLIVHGPT